MDDVELPTGVNTLWIVRAVLIPAFYLALLPRQMKQESAAKGEAGDCVWGLDGWSGGHSAFRP